MNKGKYIVIEGAQRTGKSTMIGMLASQLNAAQLPIKVIRETDNQSDLTARTVQRIIRDPNYPLNSRTEVLLYNAARSQSLDIIGEMLENGVTCIVERNFLTTLAIQYYGNGDLADYNKLNEIIDFALGDIKPDLTVILDVPVSVLNQRIATAHYDNRDEAFLERVRAGYLWEAKQRDLPVVYATDDVETVFKQVWQHVTETLAVRHKDARAGQPQSVAELLAAKPLAKTIAVEPPIVTTSPGGATQTEPQNPLTETSNEPWVKKHDNGSMSVTTTGKQRLEHVITNTEGDVYSFTNQISPITIAAAMARLSRRGDDMRVTLLDEFIGKVEKDEQLLHRVITAYGDDSVQQLVGQYLVVENASNLVAKKLEWGRLAAYLEQSTRYIYFDQKDASGHYKYFVPPELKGKIRSQYIRTMNQIFDLYSTMVNELTDYVRKNDSTPKAERDAAWRNATKAQACDVVRAVLPIAYTGTVGIYASGQALESLIMHLLGDELPEARAVGQQILDELRKVTSVFLERADKPDRGGAAIAYRANTYAGIKKLAEELLPANHAAQTEPVTLTGYTMHNELDIVADILYDHSDLPLEALRQEITKWPYQRKVDVLTAYMGERLNRRHRPGRALEKIHYSFDLVCDYGVFKALQRHRMVDDLNWQKLSPRLGYDTPKLIDQAGLVDSYEHCFELSLELYSQLHASQGSLTAQYAVLQGHNLRWKLTLNAREAFQMFELRSGPQGHPAYRRLVQQMYAKVAEVHPLLAEAMIFMNKGEDPELTRLAAERYTQYKLAQLDSTKPGE